MRMSIKTYQNLVLTIRMMIHLVLRVAKPRWILYKTIHLAQGSSLAHLAHPSISKLACMYSAFLAMNEAPNTLGLIE
jgi:hypothetical protein